MLSIACDGIICCCTDPSMEFVCRHSRAEFFGGCIQRGCRSTVPCLPGTTVCHQPQVFKACLRQSCRPCQIPVAETHFDFYNSLYPGLFRSSNVEIALALLTTVAMGLTVPLDLGRPTGALLHPILAHNRVWRARTCLPLAWHATGGQQVPTRMHFELLCL